GESLIEDAATVKWLEQLLRRGGRAMNDLQRLQAQRPPSATMLTNNRGTAPGLHARLADTDIFCLPGPPLEMHAMFERDVAPRLRPPPGHVVAARVLHTLGLPEAEIGMRLGELMHRGRNPSVGTTASGGVVSCRLRYDGDASQSQRILDELEQQVRAACDPYIFGAGDETIYSAVVGELIRRHEALVTVESCTGGLLGSMITSVPGSSAAYLGGFVTYSNDFKSSAVNVDPALIEQHGAVSKEVAEAMAVGGLIRAGLSSNETLETIRRTNASMRTTSSSSKDFTAAHSVAITGIAGPDGGTETKPVGTVFIAVASSSPQTANRKSHTASRRFRFPGDRDAVRDRAAKLALAMLRFHVRGIPIDRLLWQINDDGSSPSIPSRASKSEKAPG
ncbi:MAG TPA: nicotinamide-nucleotide amidohydrolase family protein, partial [Phycisphaerales bacterium]|nr:nicotinamide-nucleotide amidohydrolase family protein [Phycisphaerales bacterium]